MTSEGVTPDRCNILFTSAGRRVALIRLFRKALAALAIPGTIVVGDSKRDAPTLFTADEQEIVPTIDQPDYISRLKSICERHHIKLLVPLIDSELHVLAHHQREFKELGTTLLVCSEETNRICLDKRDTAKFFNKIGVETPAVLDARQLLTDDHRVFPVFLKPAAGSSSIGATTIRNCRELEFFLEYTPDAIVQEALTGEEYTLDVLADFHGKVRCVVPRLRIETRAGEVSKGVTVKNRLLMDAARHVVESLPGVLGCVTVQCFVAPSGSDGKAGRIMFTEINPRFGGGVPLAVAAGADLPRWIIEMTLGRESRIDLDSWQDGTVMLRYDDAVFVTRSQIEG